MTILHRRDNPSLKFRVVQQEIFDEWDREDFAIYPFIAAWHLPCSHDLYTRGLIQRALRESAPRTAILCREDGTWATVDDLDAERRAAIFRRARLYLDQAQIERTT